MNINEDKLDRQVYWLLRELRVITLLPQKKRGNFEYSFGMIPVMESPSFASQRKIFKMLEEWKVIELDATINELRDLCSIDDAVAFYYQVGPNWHEYFWGLIERLTYSDAHYGALEKGVEFTITIQDGWLYLTSPYIKLKINGVELRRENVPRAVFEYLVNDSKGKLVELKVLKKKLGTGISRDLSQIAFKAGFKKYMNEYFMVVCEKDALRLKTKVNLTIRDGQNVIDQLLKEEFNFNAMFNPIFGASTSTSSQSI